MRYNIHVCEEFYSNDEVVKSEGESITLTLNKCDNILLGGYLKEKKEKSFEDEIFYSLFSEFKFDLNSREFLNHDKFIKRWDSIYQDLFFKSNDIWETQVLLELNTLYLSRENLDFIVENSSIMPFILLIDKYKEGISKEEVEIGIDLYNFPIFDRLYFDIVMKLDGEILSIEGKPLNESNFRKTSTLYRNIYQIDNSTLLNLSFNFKAVFKLKDFEIVKGDILYYAGDPRYTAIREVININGGLTNEE